MKIDGYYMQFNPIGTFTHVVVAEDDDGYNM